MTAMVAGPKAKAKGDWKIWGAVGAACVLVSALALRATFYMTGVSVYPFF